MEDPMSVNDQRTRSDEARPPARPTRAVIVCLPVLCFLLAVWSSVAVAAEKTTLKFDVIRGQESVGTHNITFVRDGDRLRVDTEIAIDVELVGVPVYSYRHNGSEVWQGPYLQSLETDTNDDGKRYHVSGRRTDRGFAVEGSKGDYVVSAGVIPGSYWNPDVIRTNAVIDIETGALVDITVQDRGMDIVQAADEQVRAQRFRIDGNRLVNVWYDRSGLIVKFAVETRGEYIENRLREVVR